MSIYLDNQAKWWEQQERHIRLRFELSWFLDLRATKFKYADFRGMQPKDFICIN